MSTESHALPNAVESVNLAPKQVGERVAVLDIQRGIAILLILVVNFTNMGNSLYEHFGDARLLGWQPADQVCWWIIRLLIDGTQRGMLQFLFGAGALILLQKSLPADGPVAVADLYFRRNFWLIVFGLFDVFGLFWFGDILFPYGIAALFLFPLRRLNGKVLLALPLLYFGFLTFQAAGTYQHSVAAYTAAQSAQTKEDRHQPLMAEDDEALAARARKLTGLRTPAAVVSAERSARLGTFPVYAHWLTAFWETFVFGQYMPSYVTIVFFSTVMGMALFKFRITQGERSMRFYALLAPLCYLPGLALRISDARLFTQFQALPSKAGIFAEPARLLVTLGHVALINILVKSSLGHRLLGIFSAVGGTAFSGYLVQNFLGMWVLFPGFGFGLFGRYGWFGLSIMALGVMAVPIIVANVWLRFFAMGPLEWIWRSLTYKRVQPFLHQRAKANPVVGSGL